MSKTFLIETGAEMPTNYRRRSTYPFGQMVPGQSFDVDISEHEKPSTVSGRVRAAAYRWWTNHGGYQFQVVVVWKRDPETGTERQVVRCKMVEG